MARSSSSSSRPSSAALSLVGDDVEGFDNNFMCQPRPCDASAAGAGSRSARAGKNLNFPARMGLSEFNVVFARAQERRLACEEKFEALGCSSDEEEEDGQVELKKALEEVANNGVLHNEELKALTQNTAELQEMIKAQAVSGQQCKDRVIILRRQRAEREMAKAQRAEQAMQQARATELLPLLPDAYNNLPMLSPCKVGLGGSSWAQRLDDDGDDR